MKIPLNIKVCHSEIRFRGFGDYLLFLDLNNIKNAGVYKGTLVLLI